MEMTSHQRRAAANEHLPLPAATSSTFEPTRRSTASHSASPTIWSVVPMMVKSLDAHVMRCRVLIASRSLVVRRSEHSAHSNVLCFVL